MEKYNETTAKPYTLPDNNRFAEIEINTPNTGYPAQSIPRTHEQTVRSQAGSPSAAIPVAIPAADEKRRQYNLMREIAWENQYQRIDQSKIFYKNAQRTALARIFYKQAVFMKDFEDDYTEQAPFMSYFPNYLLMSYEQFRTYFSWRTRVRNGNIVNISASYAFLYIYELLNNVGLDDPQDCLERLVDFWKVFRDFYAFMDKYLLKWIKDFHIYYSLPVSFRDFIRDNDMSSFYPEVNGHDWSLPDTALSDCLDNSDSFELFSSISKYDIKRSVFYGEDTEKLIKECFYFVIGRIKQVINAADMDFNQLVFKPAKGKLDWAPFGSALFYPRLKQPDRRVVFSEKEIYICHQNKWTHRSAVDGNRSLIGYIIKQMEVALRKVVNYKHKITASLSMLDDETSTRLKTKGIALEKLINDAVTEFYIEMNRTVVTVDAAVLEKVRQEALDIQEKLLIIPNAETANGSTPFSATEEASVFENQKNDDSDIWTSFKQSLSKTELDALSIIQRSGDIKRFADTNGMMLEVLIDSINQKACDTINDNVLDFEDSVSVYQEYMDKITEMVMQ